MARKPMSPPTPTLPGESNPLDALMPTDPLLRAPWASCLRVTLAQPDAFAAFRRDTGCTWEPGRTPLERMIDDATGAGNDALVRFVTWFNATVWGPLDLVVGEEAR